MSGRRSPLMCMVLVASVASSGCGTRSGSDEAAVRRAIRGAVHAALIARNLRAACGDATTAGRARLLHWYRVSYNRGFGDCTDVLRFEIRNQRRHGVVSSLRRTLGVIRAVRVSGSRATAQVAANGGPYADYRSVALRKVGDRWLIDDSAAIPRGQ